jgi:hypothetical protein
MAQSRATHSDADDARLTELRDRFTYAMDQWREIRAAAKEDMRAVGGDPWNPKDRQAREDAGRVCLSLDELHQYFNQLINDVRANPRAPKFDPIGNGANDKTARFYADKMREIEYRSQAQIAYTTAFQNAVHQSYGWMKFTTKYTPKGFDQDIWIEDIPNPDLIVSDRMPSDRAPATRNTCSICSREANRSLSGSFPTRRLRTSRRRSSVKPPAGSARSVSSSPSIGPSNPSRSGCCSCEHRMDGCKRSTKTNWPPCRRAGR